MRHIGDLRYVTALSVMNAMVGLCFADVRAEQAKPAPDDEAVRRLQARFADHYKQRDSLYQADDAKLQAITDGIGSYVRERVRLLPNAATREGI